MYSRQSKGNVTLSPDCHSQPSGCPLCSPHCPPDRSCLQTFLPLGVFPDEKWWSFSLILNLVVALPCFISLCIWIMVYAQQSSQVVYITSFTATHTCLFIIVHDLDQRSFRVRIFKHILRSFYCRLSSRLHSCRIWFCLFSSFWF